MLFAPGNAADIEADILALVAERTGAAPHRITLDTDLFADLGLTGDDALLLVQAIQVRYGVDFSGFEFGRHFTGEADLPPYEGSLWTFWLWTLLGVALFVPVSSVLLSVLEAIIGWAARQWSLVWLLLFGLPMLIGWWRLGGRILPGPRAWRAQRIPLHPRDLVRAATERCWTLVVEADATADRMPSV